MLYCMQWPWSQQYIWLICKVFPILHITVTGQVQKKMGIYDEYVGNHAVVLAPSQSIRQGNTSYLCRNISLAAKGPCHRRRHCPLLLSVQVLNGLYQGFAPEKKILIQFPPNRYINVDVYTWARAATTTRPRLPPWYSRRWLGEGQGISSRGEPGTELW